jgi:hypothetical protein
MNDNLMLLDAKALPYLEPEQFVAGLPDLMPYCIPFGSEYRRDIDIRPLREIFDRAQQKWDGNRQQSDGSLAAHVHAVVRLSRREAADMRVWQFLSTEFRDYVLWRWGEKAAPAANRIAGRTNRNAIARLWWGAELTRNGADYSAVSDAFRLQEISQWILDVEAFQNRAAALAYCRAVAPGMSGQFARELATALDHALTTIVLDALAPDPGSDRLRVEHWINTAFDENWNLEELPEGPDEEPIAPEHIDAVGQLLERLGARVQPAPAPSGV